MNSLNGFCKAAAWSGVLLAGMGWAQAQTLVSGPAVKLEAEAIRQEFNGANPQSRKALSNPETLRQVVGNNYSRQVLAKEASKAGLEKNPLVKAAIERARIRILSDAMMETIDQKNQRSIKELEAIAQSQYKAEPKKFETPEEVQVRHIVIRSSEADAKQKIEAVMADLKAGKDFAEIAKEKSQDPGSAPKGGDLGFFGKGRMVPPFEEAAFALKSPGELSGIVETQFGFHILKLEARKPAGIRPFAEVKDQLMRQAESKIINDGRLAEQDRILKEAKFNAEAIEALAKEFDDKKP